MDFEDLFGGGFGMGDIFSSFFGGAAGGRAAQRREGRDMGVGLRLTLEEVAAGAKKEIVYDRLAPCPDCDGSGLGPDGREVTCPDCYGQGRVVTVQHTFLGDMQTATTCRACGGTGRTIEDPCPECDGQGRVPDRQRVTVEVPVGIRDAQQLRLSGFGEAGMRGARSGDLIVTCRIQPHEFFERDGDNLHARANVSIVQAPRRRDEIAASSRARRCSAHSRRLPERAGGARELRHAKPQRVRGDMFVHVNVVVPKKVTKRSASFSRAGRRWERTWPTRAPPAEAARRVQLARCPRWRGEPPRGAKAPRLAVPGASRARSGRVPRAFGAILGPDAPP